MITLTVCALDSPPLREATVNLPKEAASVPHAVVPRKTPEVNEPEGEVPRFLAVNVTEMLCPAVAVDGAVTEDTVRSIATEREVLASAAGGSMPKNISAMSKHESAL
jgi:hypothetical protein